MANNLIQIKRSATNATVPTLANGELAFTGNGNILYIGKPDGTGNLRIGGEQVPGVLTNGQALVANSTGYIDAVKTTTLTVRSISANGTTSPGAGYLLSVDSGGNTYWLPQSSVSINTAAQFTWSNSHSFTANVASTDANTGTIVIKGGLGVSGRINTGDVTVNGNTSLGNATSDVVVYTARVASSINPSANVTYDLGTNGLRWNEIHSQNVHSVTGNFTGSLTVGGDILVTGNLVTQNVSSLEVADPLIYLASNNYASDVIDIGFMGNYYDGSNNRHAGLIRHADDKEFYLFHRYLLEADDNVVHVDWANTDFTLATLNAFIDTGALKANATSFTVASNSTVAVTITANTLSLTTALGATDGGTGYDTYTAGDLLVASNTSYLSKLALGTDGYVLQSNGTSVVYGTLDGGTF